MKKRKQKEKEKFYQDDKKSMQKNKSRSIYRIMRGKKIKKREDKKKLIPKYRISSNKFPLALINF